MCRKKLEKTRFAVWWFDGTNKINVIFSNPTIINIFNQNFRVGFIGQIDAKSMDVTQPIWLSGCPEKSLFIAKNSPFKSGINYGELWDSIFMVIVVYHAKQYARECTT